MVFGEALNFFLHMGRSEAPLVIEIRWKRFLEKPTENNYRMPVEEGGPRAA